MVDRPVAEQRGYYPRYKETAKLQGKCRRCGRSTHRSKTFFRVASPWNRTGRPKRPRTHEEVQVQVKEAAANWNPLASDPSYFDHGNGSVQCLLDYDLQDMEGSED